MLQNLSRTVNNREVYVMKNLLIDERFSSGLFVQLHFMLCVKNFFRVLWRPRIFTGKTGIQRHEVPGKKKYATGLLASKSNEIWHADITIVKTKDNIKQYIYLLMDNYSKYILNWKIESFVSGKVRVETIREGYSKFVNRPQQVILITDGGPENNNTEMKAFVDGAGVSISPLIALKDIPFSNSVIEAQNKLFKYRYLFRKEYCNAGELKKVFASDVIDYNNLRPHISLNGYTPREVQTGINGLDKIWNDQKKDARKARLSINRAELCELCE